MSIHLKIVSLSNRKIPKFIYLENGKQVKISLSKSIRKQMKLIIKNNNIPAEVVVQVVKFHLENQRDSMRPFNTEESLLASEVIIGKISGLSKIPKEQSRLLSTFIILMSTGQTNFYDAFQLIEIITASQSNYS